MRDDDVLQRLSAALRGSPDPGIEPLLARARASAAAEATSILEALMVRSILERAADHLSRGTPGAPPSSDEPEPDRTHPRACYVYGIQRSEDDPPAGIAGVVGAPVDGVEAAGLRAIVSTVRGDEFGEQALREKLEDLQWVGENAQAHEAVLSAMLAHGPVLPLRFATVFHDQGAVAEVLMRHADDLRAEADTMVGRTEWGAKVLVDTGTCDRWIEEHIPGVVGAPTDEHAPDGRSYLVRKKAERGARDERRHLLLGLAGEVHEALSDLAVDSCTDPPQQPELSGHQGAMILNGAYLLEGAAVDPFLDAAGELSERHAAKGISVETTGPWPPYHFISLPPIGDLGEAG
jgi:hypothetical protein